MAQENGIDFYGGSAQEAGWYEKPGRIVAIFAGERLLWKADDCAGMAFCNCKVFVPGTESTALVCRNCGKPPRR